MRENDVRSQVSGARSAQNEPDFMSNRVGQTPLTATLSRVFSSLCILPAVTVMRRLSPRCSIWVTRPTSSTIPVNICASMSNEHHKPTTETPYDFLGACSDAERNFFRRVLSKRLFPGLERV